MSEKYTPKTDKEKIEYLMATDTRREKHHEEFKKDIQNLTDSFKELTSAIVGSKYNKDTGFIELFKEIKTEYKELKKEVNALNNFQQTIQPQFNIGKYVFLLFVVLLIGAVVNDIRSDKDRPKYKTETNP